MTRFGYAAVAVVAALLGIVGFSSTAQAYPEVRHSLTVDSQVVVGGDSFTATASASIDCDWDLTWNGQARQGVGTDFSTTYVAPQVSSVEKLDLVGTCAFAVSADGSAKAAASWQDRITITVRPGAAGAVGPASNNGAGLPGTGGPSRAVLLGGLVLLLAGVTAVTVARRGAEEADVPVQTA